MFSFTKLVTFFAASAAAQQCAQQGSLEIGQDQPLSLTFDGAAPFSRVISKLAATYTAVHFTDMNIPAGATLTLSSVNGKESVKFVGGESHKDLYAEWISGSDVVLTYEAATYAKAASPVFVVDKVTFGKPTPIVEAICGNDDSKPTQCYAADAPKQKSAKSVARLLIGGSSLCTGWLIGSEGHLMTNNHCIETADEAKNVQVELGAVCATCDDPNNKKQLACKGEIVATSAEFITTSALNDFTLIKLNLKAGVDLKKYGYLQIRPDGPKLGEEIHVIGNPRGFPQHAAITVDDGKNGVVTSISMDSCQPDEFGYMVDTQGGNSGSPVFSTKENVVVGLHNCGGCPNGGLKINNVLAVLKAENVVPKDAIVGDKPAC